MREQLVVSQGRNCIPTEYEHGFDPEAAARGRDSAEKASYFGLGFIYAQFRKLRAELTQTALLLEREQSLSTSLAAQLREANESMLRLSRELAEAKEQVAALKSHNAELDLGVTMAADTVKHLMDQLRTHEAARID